MTVPATRLPAANGIGSDQRTRFTADLARLWPEGGRLGLAVSGGTDSLALLLLAEAALPGRFEVATVDHGLRSASADEAAQVAALSAERGIASAILRVSVQPGNLQAKARAARYAALAEWADARGLGAIATAHHADDQAETLLMRLGRGSGVAGLAGVRGRGTMEGSPIPLLRPLLGWRRSELADILRDAGLTAVSDPSNLDPRFERVRMRRLLEQLPGLDAAAIAQSAAHLADADAALDWAAALEWDERVQVDGQELRYRPRAPRAITLRVLERALCYFGGAPRRGDVVRLVAQLEADGGGNLAGVMVRADRGDWSFAPEAPRRTSA
jgi:tRNA(Ile)-lysidine synthase